MSKYIIELNDKCARGIVVFGKTDEEVISTTQYVENLEVLNSDYINEHFGDLQDTAYQRGQIELIVAIRELIKHDNSNDWKEMGFEFDSSAWSYRLTEILGNYEPSEIIKRVKACEQKQTKRNIESDLDYLMQSTGMTIKEIAAELKERVE